MANDKASGVGVAAFTSSERSLVLPLPPETLQWGINGSYANINVLDTDKPLVRRKYSVTTLRLGRILLVSPNMTADVFATINTLTTWAEKQTKLKFGFNTYSLPACYISSCNVVVRQWRNGRPVHAEIDLELLECQADVKPADVKVKPAATKITTREQVKYEGKVLDKLKTPAKKKALGITGDFLVEVSSTKGVIITDNNGTKELSYEAFQELTA